MNEPVRVWLTDIGDDGTDDVRGLASCLALLGQSEMQRYRRFLRAQRRRQFLAGRLLLRYAACALLDVAPQALAVTERSGRAPLLELAEGAAAPFFSVSHSGRWIACAICADHAVGLDIEILRDDRDLAALAAQAFGAAGAQALAALPAAERLAAFYRRWSELEARFKLGDTDAEETGAAPVCVAVPHASLSIVICSAGALAAPPSLMTLPAAELTILPGACG